MLPGHGHHHHALGTDPRPGESLVSYIVRLSARLGHGGTPADFTGAIGMPRLSNAATDAQVAALARLSGVGPAALRDMSYGVPGPWGVFRGHRVRRAFLPALARHRSVCPGCLAAADHHHALWDFLFASACPEHGCELLDTCQACGRRLDWRTANLARCGACGADLTTASTPAVDDPARSWTALLFCALGDLRFTDLADERRRIHAFSDLNPVSLAELVYRLGAERVGPIRTTESFGLRSREELGAPPHLAVAEGASALRGGATAILDFLDRLRAAKPNGKKTGRWFFAARTWLATVPPDEGRAFRLSVAKAARASGLPPGPRRTRAMARVYPPILK